MNQQDAEKMYISLEQYASALKGRGRSKALVDAFVTKMTTKSIAKWTELFIAFCEKEND